MKLITVPTSKYSNPYNQERFNFTWRLFIFLLIIFFSLSIVHFLRNDINIYLTFSALSLVSICLLITSLTKSFHLAAIIGIIGGTLINQFDLFLIINSQRFITTLWIISISLTAFYLIGSKFGFITLFVNITGIGLSVFLIPEDTQMLNNDNAEVVVTCLNLTAILSYMTFLMNQIKKTTSLAEYRSKKAQSELQNQYEIVRAQSKEKTVMLKEIHHRVKNNLQVITSLLRLQSHEIKDKKSLKYFDDATQRVLAMALIHEKMYQSNDLAKIDLEAYLKTLTSELIISYAVDKQIDLKINCEIEYIQPKSLVSFALMFNELIANSIKHAFKNINNGLIKIDIIQARKNEVIAIYHDNGSWQLQQKESSFGLELISDLCEQLDGQLERNSVNGTTYTFTFDYLKVN